MRGLHLLLLQATIEQDGVVIDRVSMEGVDRASLLVQRLRSDNISTLLMRPRPISGWNG